MCLRFLLLAAVAVTWSGVGCRTKYREDLDYSYNVEQTWSLDELQFGQIVQFETVFWEPDDTVSLRTLIVDDRVAAGRQVLEIGTGTGLISILCLQNDAQAVVATDINPAAVANAKLQRRNLDAGSAIGRPPGFKGIPRRIRRDQR